MHLPEPMLILSSLGPLHQICPTLTITPLFPQSLVPQPLSAHPTQMTKKFPHTLITLETPRGPTEILIPQTTGPMTDPTETMGTSEVHLSRTMTTRSRPTEGPIT